MSRFFALRFFAPCLFTLAVILAIAVTNTQPAVSQDSAELEKERLTAERFLDVLLKRPRPGTSLDRVYGFHIQAGTLDELLESLTPEKLRDGVEPGAAAMLRGMILSRRGDDALAAEALAEAETLRADDAMASYYLGKSLLQIGKSDAAAEALQRSIDRKPAKNEALPVFTELGRLYQRAQQTEKAREVWQQLEATFPGDARVGQQIASTLAEEGEFDAALERYERLAKESGPADDPRVIEFRILAAEMKQRLGRSDDALADFEAIAARLRPASWLYSDVRRRIESVFLRSGDYSALADYYAALVEKRPDEIALRLRLGQALSKAGRINDAETALRETVAKAPEDVPSRLALIDVFKSAGKPDQAAEQFEQLVKLDPENPDYLIQLGNTWLDVAAIDKDARRDKTAAAWQKLATARKDDPVVIAQVADLMRRIERDEDAMRLYRQAIELAPDQPQYREYLGEYLHRLKRTDEAMEVWAQIAAPPRDDRDNLIRLAEVLNTFEQPERALETFLKAVDLDLTFAHRLRLAELLSRAERYDESLAQLDKADSAADTPEERDQIFQARIGVYADSKTLTDRIAEAQKAAEASKSADDYRKLAMMLDAAARLNEATAAIESAIAAAPDDMSTLAIAAELYRKASRLGDAIDMFRKLAKNDQRFLPNYLKRISGLQLQLGQTNEALATAAELLQAQPGNPESYRFYADQCFKVGRDDEAIQTLRRALRAAPRDRDTRQALASALANRFKTDEAIELYWELVEDSQAVDEQKRFISLMAPLYEQKGDYPRLIARIELRGREASDMRTAMLLTSAAHRAVNDLGAARQSLEPLLAENARDAELLTEIVGLAEAASEPEVALQYQQQLLTMADTPENRSRTLKLMVESGQMDATEAALQRLRELNDPVVMIELLDRTIDRRDYTSALRISETILDQYKSLWEVRLRLAALLLLENQLEESLQQLTIVESLDLPPDTLSELTKARLAKMSPEARARQQQQEAALMSPLNYSRNLYQLAQFLRVGRYASSRYSFAGSSSNALAANDYQHAKFLATAIRLAEAAKRGALEEAMKSDIDEMPVDEINSASDIWLAINKETLRSLYSTEAMQRMIISIGSPGGIAQVSPAMARQKRTSDLMWRLAELDEKNRQLIVSRQLSSRASSRNAVLPSPVQRQVAVAPPEALNDRHLELVRKFLAESKNATSSMPSPIYAAMFYNELVAAGKDDEAAELVATYETTATQPQRISENIQFYLTTQMHDRIPPMIESLKQSFKDSYQSIAANDLSSLLSVVNQVLASAKTEQKTKLDCVDLTFAMQAILQSKFPNPNRSSTSQGMVNFGYSVNGNYESVQLAVPLSGQLLPANIAQSFYQSTQFQNDTPDRRRLLEHLGNGEPLLPADSPDGMRERKLRSIVGAFAHWWADDKSTAMERIVALGQQYPADQDLAIERARLAAELNRPQASLEALESIQPTDQATLRVREMAAMNLAAKLGKLDRAKEAAERLFGMRLDAATEMTLADQMTRLGMNEMASAVLQRSQRRGGQSISDSLQIAQRFIAAGDKEAAAEVAYRSLRQLSTQSSPNNEYYKQQAVQLLRQVGRLDKLLEQAERRVAAAPNSMVLKTELAELYTAAGRQDDASKLYDSIVEAKPNDPRANWEMGKRLQQAGKNDEAVDKFIEAFLKDPSLLENEFYAFQNAVRSAKATDKAFEALTKINPDQIQPYYASLMLNLYPNSSKKPSAAAEAYLEHMLTKASIHSLSDLFRAIRRNKQITSLGAMVTATKRVFESDEFYGSDGVFFNSLSYSSGGTIEGALQPCVEILKDNKAAADEVRAMLVKRAENEVSRPTAKLVLLMLDIQDGTPETMTPEVVSERIDELIELSGDRVVQSVWWEFGQFLLANPLYANQAVTVLEHGKRATARNLMTQYEYTIDAKLTDAYVAAKQKDKARAGLIKGYEQTDNSEQNQYNPGYGDYSDLNSYRSIADKLYKIDAKLDAIRIYSDALSKPSRFENAARWGGDTRLKKTFEDSLVNTMKALRESDYIAFLTIAEAPPESAENDEKKPQATTPKDKKSTHRYFDIVPLAITIETTPDKTSLGSMVATELVKNENGREKLTAFSDQLNELATQHPDDLSIAAMRMMLAIVLEQESAVALIDDANEKVSQQIAASEESAPDSTLLFHSPAAIGLSSKSDSIREAASRLSDSLVKLAIRSERSDISGHLVYTRINHGGLGDPESTELGLNALLDALVPLGDKAGVATSQAAEKSLVVAKIAAEANAWNIFGNALRRGFGGGPPLRMMQSQGNADPFGFATSPRNVNSGNERKDNSLDLLTKQVWDLVEPIAYKEISGEENENVEEDKETLNQIYEALRDIILPETRPDEAFPYAEMFLSEDRDIEPKPGSYPISLSRLLARAAHLSGRGEALEMFLSNKREKTGAKHKIDLLRIHLAIVQKDKEPAESAAQDLVEQLKAMKGVQDNTSPVFVNELLHVALPMHDVFGLSPALIEIEMHMIEQAKVNPSVATAGNTWKRMVRDIVNFPGVDKEVSTRVIDNYLDSVRLRYTNYGGDYALQQYNAELKSLGSAVTDGANWRLAGRMLHQAVVQEPGFKPDGNALARLAISAMDAKPEEKFHLFSSILFGESDSTLVSTANLFMYDNPPVAFDGLYKGRKRFRDVPIADVDFPIVELSLLAAEAAAKCGASEELAKRFETHIKEPGDEAEAMVGLTWLVAGKHDEAAVRLKRVIQRLNKTAPDKNVSTPMPIVESVFVARAFSVESMRDDAAATWKPILKHAQRRNLSIGASMFNRMAVKAGGTVVDDGTSGSPLEHFVSVQVPYVNCPVSAMTEPLYVYKDSVLHQTAGTGHTILMFKYPIEGDFQFSHRNIRRGWGESHNFFGGVAYMTKPHESSVLIRGVAHRNTSKFNNAPTYNDKDNVITLVASDDKLAMQLNEKEVAVDRRTSSMPFFGVVFEHHVIASAADISLQGKPTIASKVDLIGEDLRGWHTPIIWGQMKPIDLPSEPGQDQVQMTASRLRFDEQPEAAAWREADGELRGRGDSRLGVAGAQSHLQYIRPLLDGESFSYKFDYKKGELEIHPAIGRIVVLVRENGVKLRWLMQEMSSEFANVDALHEVAPDEIIGDGKPELIDGENAVKVTVEGDSAIVEINGKPVCKFELATDRRFGLVTESQRQSVVRQATLTGPWPTEMPSEILSPAKK